MKKTLFESFGDAIILVLLIPFILAFLALVAIFKPRRKSSFEVFDDKEISWRMRGQI